MLNTNSAPAIATVVKKIGLFHAIILAPSKGIIGIMLNIANKAFINNPVVKNNPKNPSVISNEGIRNNNAKIILVAGPARDIFPFLDLVISPWIMTAPGAANIIPPKAITTDKNNILKLALNSA